MPTKMIAQYAGFVNPDDFAQDVAAAISNTDDRTGETPVETALATTIATPGSEVRAAVESVTNSRASRGNTTVFLGDSITKRISDIGAYDTRDYPMWAMLASDGRIRLLYNAGIGGDNTAEILTRLDADVIAHNPTRCVALMGTNDIGDNIYATTTDRLATAYERIQAAGIELIPATMTPRTGMTADQKLSLHTTNAWIRQYAAEHSLVLFDAYAAMVDPATGDFRAGESVGDGLHPNATGAKALGDACAAALGPFFSPVDPLWATVYDDPTNLLGDGVFVVDSNANGAADVFTVSTVDATATTSLVAGTNGVIGNWQRIAVSAATAGQYCQLSKIISTGFAVGDRIAFCGRLDTSALGSGTASVYLNFSGSSQQPSALGFTNLTTPALAGGFHIESEIPPGTTSLQFRAIVSNAPGTLDIAQIAVRNLTTLGLD